MTSSAQNLVEFLASFSEAALTPELLRSATMAVLDGVGCGLYGSAQTWGKIVNDFVLSERSQGAATLYGCSHPVAPARAALANGTSTHGFEFDDILYGQSHPGAAIIPAALAAAEQAQASGLRLLTGVIAGYEMMGRLGSALGASHSHRGFHTTGIAGPIAATMAAGIVMGLGSPRLLAAIGNACSSASGIKAFTQGTGGMTKRMHAGRAAESGVVACELAARGFTGPMQAIDGPFGLLQVIGDEDAQPELLDHALGTSFAITQVWVKVYPCCGVIHSTAHALETLKAQHGFSAENVREVRVHMHHRGCTQNGGRNPVDTMAAQYSIPFCVGVAIAKNPRDPQAFAQINLGDASVRKIAERTVLIEDETIERLYPGQLAARVEVSLDNGRAVESTILDAHGTAADPCTAEDIEAKFRGLTASIKPYDTIERIIGAVSALPSARSVQALSDALREQNL